jgi:hypothetical protein
MGFDADGYPSMIPMTPRPRSAAATRTLTVFVVAQGDAEAQRSADRDHRFVQVVDRLDEVRLAAELVFGRPDTWRCRTVSNT